MYNFKFADIGEGIHEGVIHEWHVEEGGPIKEGSTLFSVETDKITAEIPSPVDGIIKKINFEVGQTIYVGDIAVVIDDGSGEAAEEAPAAPAAAPAAPAPAAASAPAAEKEKESAGESGASVVGEIEVSSELIPSSTEGAAPTKAASGRKALATPVARHMAKELGLDINQIQGTGPNGRVMKEDIQKAADSKGAAAPAAFAGHAAAAPAQPLTVEGRTERVKLSQIRKTIAKNMVRSKFTIPHTATMDEVDVSALVKYRKALNEKMADRGIKFSFLPFIIKAVAAALKKFPIMNSSLDESTDEIILKHFVNIGLATDTENGLTVPVLKDADQMGILEIHEKITAMAEAARENKLALDDLKGGSFTISNYGTLGTRFGVPVINFPEVAILGIGTIYKKPGVSKTGTIEIQDTLPLSLCFDHRVIDGGDAGRFTVYLKQLFADPDMLLLV